MKETSTRKPEHPAKMLLGDPSLLHVSPKLLQLLQGDFRSAALFTRVIQLFFGRQYQGNAVPIADREWADYLQCSVKTVSRIRKKLKRYGLDSEAGWSWRHFEPHVYSYSVNIDRVLAIVGRTLAETIFRDSECPF